MGSRNASLKTPLLLSVCTALPRHDDVFCEFFSEYSSSAISRMSKAQCRDIHAGQLRFGFPSHSEYLFRLDQLDQVDHPLKATLSRARSNTLVKRVFLRFL
jgi:hypothetical protein